MDPTETTKTQKSGLSAYSPKREDSTVSVVLMEMS